MEGLRDPPMTIIFFETAMKTEEKSEAEHLDKVKQALREVAQHHGMTDAHLNPYEGLGLELHDGQEICLEYVADRHKLFIYTPLMELVRDTVKRQAMLEVALQMNCLESGAASSALHQARPFSPHGGGRIQSWDALWDLLDQGPPFPAKMFDGMLTFLSREGKDWIVARKRWEQQGRREGQAPRRPDAGYFTKLAAPESESSQRGCCSTPCWTTSGGRLKRGRGSGR